MDGWSGPQTASGHIGHWTSLVRMGVEYLPCCQKPAKTFGRCHLVAFLPPSSSPLMPPLAIHVSASASAGRSRQLAKSIGFFVSLRDSLAGE